MMAFGLLFYEKRNIAASIYAEGDLDVHFADQRRQLFSN